MNERSCPSFLLYANKKTSVYGTKWFSKKQATNVSTEFMRWRAILKMFKDFQMPLKSEKFLNSWMTNSSYTLTQLCRFRCLRVRAGRGLRKSCWCVQLVKLRALMISVTNGTVLLLVGIIFHKTLHAIRYGGRFITPISYFINCKR